MGSCSSFRVSDGWLAGFKKRHNIRLMRTNERNVVANEEGANKFIKDFEKLMKREDITMWITLFFYRKLFPRRYWRKPK